MLSQRFASGSRRRVPRRVAVAVVALGSLDCSPPSPPTPQAPPQPAHLQEGVASWYGRTFAGRRTASGEIFDPERLTAASPSLPLGSVVQVTNRRNGRKVVVRVNDRGPFARGRILDCSEAAARRLGYLSRGKTRVTIDWPPLGDASAEGARRERKVDPAYWVQLGAFESPLLARELRAKAAAHTDTVDLHRQGGYVRVHAGPFAARSTAESICLRLREAGFSAVVMGPISYRLRADLTGV
jgi:rare lipoprotein A